MSHFAYHEKLLHLSNLYKGFGSSSHYVPILKDVCLTISSGERCALLGSSGSGKSTLLNILGLLDSADAGEYWFADHAVFCATPNELAQIRNRHIGFVFQSFNLIPRLSAIDNVALPLRYRNIPPQEARQRALHMLCEVGLEHRAHYRPADLSGGQRQRVAIARALIGEPSLILADEPTGNLDPGTANDIMDLLLSLNRQHRVTLVVVTHDWTVASRLDRQIHVNDGWISECCPCPT